MNVLLHNHANPHNYDDNSLWPCHFGVLSEFLPCMSGNGFHAFCFRRFESGWHQGYRHCDRLEVKQRKFWRMGWNILLSGFRFSSSSYSSFLLFFFIFFLFLFLFFFFFLDASMHLYMRVCLSVGPSVHPCSVVRCEFFPTTNFEC